MDLQPDPLANIGSLDLGATIIWRSVCKAMRRQTCSSRASHTNSPTLGTLKAIPKWIACQLGFVPTLNFAVIIWLCSRNSMQRYKKGGAFACTFIRHLRIREANNLLKDLSPWSHETMGNHQIVVKSRPGHQTLRVQPFFNKKSLSWLGNSIPMECLNKRVLYFLFKGQLLALK